MTTRKTGINTEPTATAAVITEIMLAVFRVNGRLLERGDELVGPLGLTSARWQVVGAVALAGRPLTAPQIAEAMGITRQGAQKQLNRLREEGLVEPRSNPRHGRSPLYVLTRQGALAYARADALQGAWAKGLGEGVALADLRTTLRTLQDLQERLELPLVRKGEEQ